MKKFTVRHYKMWNFTNSMRIIQQWQEMYFSPQVSTLAWGLTQPPAQSILGLLSWGQCSQGMKMTIHSITHSYLGWRWQIYSTTSLSYTFVACAGTSSNSHSLHTQGCLKLLHTDMPHASNRKGLCRSVIYIKRWLFGSNPVWTKGRSVRNTTFFAMHWQGVATLCQ
jgi:hypothetical protein